MKSRSLLLVAILFAVPAFADETPATKEAKKAVVAVEKADQAKAKEAADKKAKKDKEAKEAAVEAKEAEAKADKKAKEATKATEVAVEKAEEAKDKAKEAEAKEQSWLAAKWAALGAASATAVDYTIAPVANYSTIPALNQFLRIEYLKGGKFENNIPVIGKTIIGLALVAAAVYGYKLATADADDVDNDDSTFFNN